MASVALGDPVDESASGVFEFDAELGDVVDQGLGLLFEFGDFGAERAVVGDRGVSVGLAAAADRVAKGVELVEPLDAALEHDHDRRDIGEGASCLCEGEDLGGHARSVGGWRGGSVPE